MSNTVSINRELLLCPFCGADAELDHDDQCFFTVDATFREKAGNNADLSLAPAVLRAWNRRIHPSVPVEAGLVADLARVTAQRDAILQQARTWACEAKFQRSTVLDVGDILGGIPDWGPIAAGVLDQANQLAEARRLLQLVSTHKLTSDQLEEVDAWLERNP